MGQKPLLTNEANKESLLKKVKVKYLWHFCWRRWRIYIVQIVCGGGGEETNGMWILCMYCVCKAMKLWQTIQELSFWTMEFLNFKLRRNSCCSWYICCIYVHNR